MVGRWWKGMVTRPCLGYPISHWLFSIVLSSKWGNDRFKWLPEEFSYSVEGRGESFSGGSPPVEVLDADLLAPCLVFQGLLCLCVSVVNWKSVHPPGVHWGWMKTWLNSPHRTLRAPQSGCRTQRCRVIVFQYELHWRKVRWPFHVIWIVVFGINWLTVPEINWKF